MELLVYAVGAIGTVLVLIVLMSPAIDHGRRPIYTTVGLDRHQIRELRRRAAAADKARARHRVAPAAPIHRPVAPTPVARPAAQLAADQVVASLLPAQRTT